VIVSSRKAIIALAVFCAIAAALGVGVYLVNPTADLNAVLGIGVFGFFGVGGGIAFVTQWRRSVVLRADAAGLSLPPRGHVPWADVDRVGATADVLGIRLRRYDALLASRTELTAGDLKVSRHHTGFDLTWPARLLDRTPAEAAAAIRAHIPAG